ncbi:MAG: CHAP domain-containing protein [Rhodospirillales bacterium]|nr:CHAP domain-containing protein [Rhodospirillales bacterium]
MALGRFGFFYLPGLALGLALAGCASGPRLESPSHFGTATHLSCVPYARAVSGVQLDGNAYEWWREADGIYPRAHQPVPGAVLVFKPHGAMDVGHLAVVTAIESPREVLVTQSNWLPHRIEYDQPVVDVSRGNNWSLVRVWYEPAHALGITRYPAYGFILPN